MNHRSVNERGRAAVVVNRRENAALVNRFMTTDGESAARERQR